MNDWQQVLDALPRDDAGRIRPAPEPLTWVNAWAPPMGTQRTSPRTGEAEVWTGSKWLPLDSWHWPWPWSLEDHSRRR